MKNIIKFEIIGEYEAYHNGKVMTHNIVDCVSGNNTLQIKGNNILIDSVTMYDLGKEHLVKLLTFKDNCYTLTYEYPVFTWLHQQLNHGWLIKKDNEE